MDKTISTLMKSGNTEEIKNLLLQKDIEEIVDCVTDCIVKGKNDPFPVIKGVTSNSTGSDERSIQLCINVYTGIIKVLQKNEINSRMAFGIVSLLLTEIDAVQPTCLAELSQFYVDSVKNGTFNGGKAAELLPKILSLICACETVPRGDGSIKGQELKGHIVNSLCSSRWTPSVAIHMAPLFQDIPLTLDELKFVVEKIIRLFTDLELADQPAAVFQLLRLSAKGHKKLVLEGISKHYTAQDDVNRGRSIMVDSEDLMTDSTCLTTLRQIEGTVILHITQAVKQDQEMGTELIKYLKVLQLSSPTKVISPFNLSLLLSISQLHQFEEQIFEFVKSTILKCLRDEERQKLSLWVRECYPVGIKTEELVLEAVEHSKYDWDHVIQGLVKLGFGLMDSFGPKLVFGAMPESVSADGHQTPTQLACQLGRRMLLKTFKAHEVVRSEILDQIFSYIVMKSASPVSHYLDLLSDTVMSAPQLLLESSGKVQEIFVKLAQLPPKSAEGLMLAIQPLLKLSPHLKDTLILVLRKAMFSRQLDSRKIGALGFLMILKNFRVLGGLPSSQASQPISLSQLQVDVHSRYNAASNEALCLEILGNLRRCFTQQADIRLSIYQGLYEVLHRNSQLMNPVHDMLLSQLKKYFESNEDVCPPLRLEPCIVTQGDQVFLAEPLAHLVACVQQCVRKSEEIQAQMQQTEDEDDDDGVEKTEDQQSFKQLQTILSSLTKRIIESDMEDFELDKSADFSVASGVGVKNNIYAILLIGLYEVLMEYTFEIGKCSAESCKQVLELFTKQTKITTVLREKASTSAGKKGKPAKTKTPNSHLSLQCVVSFLQTITDDHSTQHEGGINQMRENKDFLPYLVAVATQKLTQVAHKGFCDGETQNKEKVFKMCCKLGRLFYLHYVENQAVGDGSSQHDKQVTTQCLEGLGLVISIASNNGALAVLQCLTYLEKEPEEEKEHLKESETNGKIHKHTKKFQRLISTILSETREHQNWKEVSTLLLIIASLSSHLLPEGEEYHQVYTWVLKVATDQNIDDAGTCKQVLTVLLNLAKQTKSQTQLLRNICQDIHSQLGDIEQDMEVDDRTHLSVTRAAHCPTTGILTMVLTHMDCELDDVEWAIKRHKAEMLAAGASSTDDSMSPTQVEGMEKSICTRLGMLVTGFMELTRSGVKTKPCQQALLKSLTKLYNTLTSLTKHYISMYTSKAGHLGSRFEKLITLIGKELTQSTYNMIIFVQASEAEYEAEKKEKDKGKKKGGSTTQVGMANAIKQMKTIPNLIFAIEQLEKFLIQLSKKSKVNLMENIKLSTSRDFRINPDTVNTVVEQGMSSDNESEASDGEQNNDNDEVTNENQNNDDSSDSERENKQPPAEEEEEEIPSSEPPVKKKKLLSRKASRK